MTPPHTLPGVTCPESPGSFPSQTLYLGSDIQVPRVTPFRPCIYGHMSRLQDDVPPRQCTWGHMSTVSKVIPSSNPAHLSLVHCVQNDLTPDPAPGVTLPQSPGWPHHTRLCTWGHISTVGRVTLSQTLYLGSHSYSPLVDPSQALYLESHIHSL